MCQPTCLPGSDDSLLRWQQNVLAESQALAREKARADAQARGYAEFRANEIERAPARPAPVVAATRPDKDRIEPGDMVVTKDGKVGLVCHINRAGGLWPKSTAYVTFGNNLRPRVRRLSTLRRAISAEIQEAGLAGVGRNPAPDEEAS